PDAQPESMTEVTLEIADSAKVARGGEAGWVCLREQPRRPAVGMRGGGNPLPASDLSGPVTLMIARSVRMVALSLPMNRMRSKPEVRMELRSEKGTTLYASDHKGSDFPEHASVLLSNHGRPLESGTYTLSIAEKVPKKPRVIRVKNLNQEYVVPPDT